MVSQLLNRAPTGLSWVVMHEEYVVGSLKVPLATGSLPSLLYPNSNRFPHPATLT